MGKRSDRRKFRRRRQAAGFVLLVSLALVVGGALLFSRVDRVDLQPSAFRNAENGTVQRVESPDIAGAPEAVDAQQQDKAAILGSEEQDKKTAAEKQQVDKEAAQKEAAQKAAAKQAAQKPAPQPAPQAPAIPKPATNDLWMSIPALGLYDLYVTNSSDPSALDYGAVKLPETGFPWQDNANTYIAGHRLGWPNTGSYHLFYNLPLLALGDVIYLGDDNGTTYTYQVTDFKEITPDDTSITGPQAGRDMVSLQTCIENFGDYWTMGPHWYVRYIVQADRVSVDAAN